jgi:hypothetical protein
MARGIVGEARVRWKNGERVLMAQLWDAGASTGGGLKPVETLLVISFREDMDAGRTDVEAVPRRWRGSLGARLLCGQSASRTAWGDDRDACFGLVENRETRYGSRLSCYLSWAGERLCA